MIEKCNFKMEKHSIVGTPVFDCSLCSMNIISMGGPTCKGESNCILYEIYRMTEKGDY